MKIIVLIAALVGNVLFSGGPTVKCRNRCQNRLIAETVQFVAFSGYEWKAEKWGPNGSWYGLVAGPANQMDPAEFSVYLSQVHQACARLDEECGQGGDGTVAMTGWDSGAGRISYAWVMAGAELWI